MRLFNDSCLNVFKNISDEGIDLICTDPPGGGLVWDYAPEFYRVLKNGSHLYVMCTHANLIEYLNVFTDCGFRFIKSLIWDKETKTMGRFYMSCFEYILFFRKGDVKQINNCNTPDILSCPNIKTRVDGEPIHEMEKPVELMKCLIENSTQLGDLVLDPFMGSGTTGVAALSCGRDFMGCEIEPQYFHICEQRMNGDELTLYKTEVHNEPIQKVVKLW